MSQTVSIYHTTIVPSRGSQVGDGSLSPTQTDGPRTLRLEDPSRRGTTSRSSIDVVIPALRRTYASSCLPLLDSTSWLQRCALVTLRVWIRRETITGPVQPPRGLVIHSPLSMRHQHQKMVKFLWRVPIPGLMGKWLAGNLGHREQGLLTMPVAWTHTVQQWTWARTSINKHKLENSQNQKRFNQVFVLLSTIVAGRCVLQCCHDNQPTTPNRCTARTHVHANDMHVQKLLDCS